jgi:hypothetical protein
MKRDRGDHLERQSPRAEQRATDPGVELRRLGSRARRPEVVTANERFNAWLAK